MSDTFNLAAFVPEKDGIHYPLMYVLSEKPQINFGAAKLVARFAQLLLTLKGSDKTDPLAGCTLLALVSNFHTSEKSFLQSEIAQILEDVNFQMRFENDPNAPPESIFVNAECIDIQYDGDTVHLHFLITSATQQQIEFRLPIVP